MLRRSVYMCAICLLGVTLLIMPLATEADDPPPRIPSIPHLTAYEDEIFTLDLSVFFQGNGSEGNLTWYDDSPLVATDPVTGMLVWDMPTWEHVGEHYITVTFVDEHGRSDQWEIKITVVHVCSLPWWPVFNVQRLTQGIPYRLDASLHLEEYCAEHCFVNITYTNDHRELFVIDPYTGTIDLTPANEQVGSWSVTINATAESGFFMLMTIEIVIANVNDPPQLGAFGGQVMTEDEPYQVQLLAYDRDLEPRLVDPNVPVDPQEALTFEGGLPGCEVDPVTGVFTYTPTNDDARNRTLSVTFNVTDAQGARDSVEVVFRVMNVEQPPQAGVVGLVEGQKVDRNRKVELTGLAWDEWGRPWGVQYLWYMDDKYLGEGETFTWKPPYSGEGRHRVRLVVVNGTNQRVEASVNVTLYHLDYPGPDYHLLSTSVGLALLIAGVLMTATLIVRRNASVRGSANDPGIWSDGDLGDRTDGRSR